MRALSPDEFLAIFRSLLTDCLQFTPIRLASPLRPGFLPSAKFSVMNSLALTVALGAVQLKQNVRHTVGAAAAGPSQHCELPL